MMDNTTKLEKEPLFKKLEKKYIEEEESEFEKRKKHLASLRDLRAPLNRD
jgi:hypothetical protein